MGAWHVRFRFPTNCCNSKQLRRKGDRCQTVSKIWDFLTSCKIHARENDTEKFKGLPSDNLNTINSNNNVQQTCVYCCHVMPCRQYTSYSLDTASVLVSPSVWLLVTTSSMKHDLNTAISTTPFYFCTWITNCNKLGNQTVVMVNDLLPPVQEFGTPRLSHIKRHKIILLLLCYVTDKATLKAWMPLCSLCIKVPAAHGMYSRIYWYT